MLVPLKANNTNMKVHKHPLASGKVENVSDDIIVDGPDQESHDQGLLAVLKRLERCELQIRVNSKQIS